MKPRVHQDVRRLIERIDAYRQRNGNMDRTRFGLLAANDGHLIPRWLSGRQPRLSTMDRVKAFLERDEDRDG